MLCSRTAGDLLDIKSQMSTEGTYWSLICVHPIRFRVLGYPVACARAPCGHQSGVVLSYLWGLPWTFPGLAPGRLPIDPGLARAGRLAVLIRAPKKRIWICRCSYIKIFN